MIISRDLVGGGAAAHQDAVAAGVLQRQPECERAARRTTFAIVCAKFGRMEKNRKER